MFWLYLLAAVTVLTIALRRVLRRQTPLDDELYSKKVAVEHVQSGVGWVGEDGRIGSVNQAFAKTFRCTPEKLAERIWLSLIAEGDREKARAAYSQMLLAGIDSFDCQGVRDDGSLTWLNIRLVAGHDHNMRLVGHHCMIEDRTRVHELEERLKRIEDAISKETAKPGPAPLEFPKEAGRRAQRLPGAARA